MGEDRILVIEWPELIIKVECEPLKFNREYYEWFLDNLPLKGIQSHAVASGRLLFDMTLQLSIRPPFAYRDLKMEVLSEEDIGRVNTMFAASQACCIMVKYGIMTENFSRATIAQVVESDIEKLKEVGVATWNAVYKTKDIITVNYKVK